MRAISFVALVVALHVSSASGCSIDALKKIAAIHLERLPSDSEHEFPVDPNESLEGGLEGGGGSWQVFEGASGAPHSIVITVRNELGQDKLRISFLNRRDFVITDTVIFYPKMIREKKELTEQDTAVKYLIGPPERYFYCGGELQIPANAPDRDNAILAGNYWKDLIFNYPDLKPDIQRVPE